MATGVGECLPNDARRFPAGHVLAAEVCVVGGGPAGIVLAGALAEAGLDVVVLESGGDTVEAGAQSLSRVESVGQPYWPVERTRYRAFGGSSHHWECARARPLDDLDFESHTGSSVPGWPISRESLDSFYAAAQAELGLGPASYDTGYWEQRAGANRLPLDESLVTTAMFQFGQIDSMLRRRPALDAAPNVRVIRHATVLELVADENAGRVTSVTAASAPNRRFTVSAGTVVLAGGGIENARLLLLSRLGNAYDQVGRYFMEHPHLRAGLVMPIDDRMFRDGALYQMTQMGGFSICASLSPAAERLRDEQLLNSTFFLHARPAVFTSAAAGAISGLWEGWRFQPQPGRGPRVRTLATHPLTTVGAGTEWLLQHFTERSLTRPQVLELRVMSEQEPNPSSRVTLSSRRDAFGQPMPRLDWRLTDLDRHSIRRGQELLDKALQSAGLGRVEQMLGDEAVEPAIGGGCHHMGTTRMSADPRHGVVDTDCRVHGIGNLYVAGSSVFPTVGYANPTLTIVAMTLRLAAHLRATITRPLRIQGAEA